MDFLDKIKSCIKGNRISNKRDFYSSLNSNRRDVNYKNIVGTSNCIGTALYLTGERDKDEFLFGKHTRLFNKLSQSEEPGLGYLVAWINKSNEVYHAAVITGLNPLTVATRNGSGKLFTPKQNIEDTNRFFVTSNFSEIKYFVPSKLQKVLNKEALN